MNSVLEFPKMDKDTIKCVFCGIRPATRLWDYETGLLFDALDDNGHFKPIQKCRCSATMCDKCSTKINGKDYCPNHILDLKYEIEQKTKK